MRRRRLWAVRMLFVWRSRLGYWDWDAFRSAWRTLFPSALLVTLLGACGGASTTAAEETGLELPDYTGALTIDMGGQWFLSDVHLVDIRGHTTTPAPPPYATQVRFAQVGVDRFEANAVTIEGGWTFLNRPSLETWIELLTTIYRNQGDGRQLVFRFVAPLEPRGELLVDVVLATLDTLTLLGRFSVERRGTLSDSRVIWQGRLSKITGFTP